MYKCKSCGKDFPVVAWIEIATMTYPNLSFQNANLPSNNPVVTNTNWNSTTTIKKPSCPYCQQLDIEEIVQKDDFWEEFKLEFLKALREKMVADKSKEGKTHENM